MERAVGQTGAVAEPLLLHGKAAAETVVVAVAVEAPGMQHGGVEDDGVEVGAARIQEGAAVLYFAPRSPFLVTLSSRTLRDLLWLAINV